jgi:hypothetical protein
MTTNPYQPPEPNASAPPARGPQGNTEKPPAFMFATVSSLVLGALGICAGVWVPLNFLLQQRMRALFHTPGVSGSMAEQMAAVSTPWWMVGVGLLNLLTGAWVVWATIRLFQRKPGARHGFRLALSALSGYELLALGAVGVQQYRLFSFMSAFTQQARMPGGEEMLQPMMNAMWVFSAAFAVVWAGCKIGFALWARAWANKPLVIHYAEP